MTTEELVAELKAEVEALDERTKVLEAQVLDLGAQPKSKERVENDEG